MTVCFIAAAVFACAAMARWYLDRSSRRDSRHFRSLVELTAVWNRGAAFSLPIPRRVVELCSIPALLAALALGRRSRLGAGLMLGGGAANLYERRRHGRVYDYVRFPHAWGKWKRYVYNLADFAILLGAAALVLSRGRGGKSPRRP